MLIQVDLYESHGHDHAFAAPRAEKISMTNSSKLRIPQLCGSECGKNAQRLLVASTLISKITLAIYSIQANLEE